jgi:hypothetical protein
MSRTFIVFVTFTTVLATLCVFKPVNLSGITKKISNFSFIKNDLSVPFEVKLDVNALYLSASSDYFK